MISPDKMNRIGYRIKLDGEPSCCSCKYFQRLCQKTDVSDKEAPATFVCTKYQFAFETQSGDPSSHTCDFPKAIPALIELSDSLRNVLRRLEDQPSGK